jgi:hypothetical protein
MLWKQDGVEMTTVKINKNLGFLFMWALKAWKVMG